MPVFDALDDPVLGALLRLAIAYALAMPIAWDREARARGVGLRTFPLVAIASCAFVIIGQVALEGSDAQDKILAGLMTGIGFIGGGAILKSGNNVMGTATAASIWNMGLIGIAVAFDRYEVAVLMSIINLLTLRFVRRFKVEDTEKD